jgi:hypothetical protein
VIRRLAVALGAAAVVLLVTPAALAKSYTMPLASDPPKKPGGSSPPKGRDSVSCEGF